MVVRSERSECRGLLSLVGRDGGVTTRLSLAVLVDRLEPPVPITSYRPGGKEIWRTITSTLRRLSFQRP